MINIAVNKSICNELNIIIHVIASQLCGHFDAISNRLWRHQQNVNRASETRGWCVKVEDRCLQRNLWIRYVVYEILSWRTVYALTRVLYWCFCPACRTTLIATRFRVAVIGPIIQVPHCIRVLFYFVWFVFINHIFQFYYELCTYCNILDIYLS